MDVFFVISGFLITFLLLKELGGTGRLRFGRFYARRARRLLPPLVVTLAATLLILWQFGSVSELRGAASTAVFSLAQIANWQQIGANTAYWEQSGQIVPLGQMWSLSATEQFYLVWPVLLLAVWAVTRRHPRLLIAMLFGGFVLSALVAPLLFDGSNADRLYLGTDARAVSFIAGAALASLVSWVLMRQPVWAGLAPSRSARGWITGLSIATLLAVVGASIATTSYHEAWLYQGGLAAVSLAVAIFVATLCFPANALIPAFSRKLFTSIGVLSYSLFLVHLPVYWAVQNVMGAEIHPLMLFAVGGSLSYLAALTLHYMIAEPLRVAKWTPRGATIAIIVSFGLVLAAAWYLPTQKVDSLKLAASQEQAGFDQLFAVNGDVPIPTHADGSPLTVAVVGDSVAGNMYTSLAEYGSGGLTPIHVTYGGCGIFDADSAKSDEGFVMDTPLLCWSWKDKLRGVNAEASPDVYILHNLWDANDQLIDGAWVGPGTPEWTARYEAQLELFVSIAGETGKEPLILISNDRPRSVDGMLSRERLDAVNAVDAAVSAKHTNVQILDFESTTCSDGKCLTKDANGQDLYYDGTHFSDAGLMRLAPWLEGQIATAWGK